LGAHDLDNVASDANVDDSVSGFRGTHKNPAGTHHLEALLDQNAFFGMSDTMGDHPGGGAPGRRPGSRVFSVVEEHARVQTGRGIHGFARDKVEELSITMR
jgi:hypothetical protein